MKIRSRVNDGVLMIPVQLSEFFSESEYIITMGIGNCFFVIKRKLWKELTDILEELPDGITTRKLQRLLLSAAMEVTIEKKLLMLPNYYISRVGGKDVDVQVYFDEKISKNMIIVQKNGDSEKENEEYERNVRIIKKLQQ